MQFNVSQRFSFTPDQLKKQQQTLHMSVLLDGRHSNIQTFQRNLSVLGWMIFHLKSVNFLLLFVQYIMYLPSELFPETSAVLTDRIF